MASNDPVLARGTAAVDTAGVTEHFWLLTHEEMRVLPLDLMDRVATQTIPALLGAD